MNEQIKTMHLFAGAGGGILADLILGHRPVVAVEWEKYPADVLKQRAIDGWFPGLDVYHGDVREFAAYDYQGRVDCIHAGFPCQDISVAGGQAGVEEGTRSGLYREVLRIADEVRPRYLFLENVANIVSGDDGRMLRAVVGDLAQRGYDAVWTCLSAAQVGANHKRDRWWLLAYPRCELRSEGNSTELDAQEEVGTLSAVHDKSGGQGQPLADTDGSLGKGNERSERGEPEPANDIKYGWWEAEPAVGRVANGVAGQSHRLKALGNGQVPLQCAVAFKYLWEQMEIIKNDRA